MGSRAASAWAGKAPRDRLMAMLFIAAVLHGVLILGVTFSSPLAGGRGAPGLKVLLVTDQLPRAPHNATATYLAQRTQLGSGNTLRDVPPSVARARTGSPRGATGGQATAPAARRASGGREPVITTSGWSTQVAYLTTGQPGTLEQTLEGNPAAAAFGQGGTGPVRLRGPKRELWVSPDTRAALVAPYLVAWRHKVERIGTLNFPLAARESHRHGNPVIEVAIDADGTLARALIRRSSGDAALDQAALAILKLASPFDPFPPRLARRYRVLRFTYEWQFVGGRMRGSVAVP